MTAYAVFVVILILTTEILVRRDSGGSEKTHAPEPESQGSFLAKAICSYFVFLAIVLVFHVGWRKNPTRSSAPFGVDSSDR